MSNQFTTTKKARLVSLPEAEVLDSLPTQLARLYHGFVALVDRLREEGAGKLPNFRPGAGSVYFTLLKHEGCTAKELTELLKMPKATVSGLLDGLERDGVIERKPCPNDGRALRLRLTRFGRALEQGFGERHQRAISILEAGLNAHEAAELKRMLRQVLGNLDRIREQGLQTPKARNAAGKRKAA
ncbi:MAG TPA: MarR family transcriptional regulator [Prosthecobacter sp.]|nr:MarR family transcriptional regulator [Prosthecobacter sp.]